MKTAITIVLGSILMLIACSGEKGSQNDKPADSVAKVTQEGKTSDNGVISLDPEKVPAEMKQAVDEISNCLKSAVDNAGSAQDGLQAMKACEIAIRERFKDQLEKEPAFAKYFDEIGEQIYNSEKIRLKEKFAKK